MNELRTLSLLVWLVEDRLTSYIQETGTIEEDEEFLKDEKLNFHERTAIKYQFAFKSLMISFRMLQKQMLTNLLGNIQAKQEEFNSLPQIQELMEKLNVQIENE